MLKYGDYEGKITNMQTYFQTYVDRRGRKLH